MDFGREFDVDRLAATLSENIWLRDLLARWTPAGEAVGQRAREEDNKHLRLAIRNKSLNFYRAGRSIAEVKLRRDGTPQAEIHEKYVYRCGKDYVKLTSSGYRKVGPYEFVSYNRSRLDEWISNANCYLGRDRWKSSNIRHEDTEKEFIDRIVAQNPSVIDLEAALPSKPNNDKPRRAVRMDLVTLERVNDWWKVVFWEVKLVNDQRARSKKEPKVLEQLGDYTDWLKDEEHQKLMAHAYQRTCCLLVKLHAIAKRVQPNIQSLAESISAIARSGAPCPLIDKKPRMLIGALRDKEGRDPKKYDSFNSHLKKLRDDHGLHVQVVRDPAKMALDTLA